MAREYLYDFKGEKLWRQDPIETDDDNPSEFLLGRCRHCRESFACSRGELHNLGWIQFGKRKVEHELEESSFASASVVIKQVEGFAWICPNCDDGRLPVIHPANVISSRRVDIDDD